MTKHDFAIHLFSQARRITSGSASRVPVVSLLIMLLLSKRPEEWISGTVLAADFPTVTPSVIASSTRAAVEAGYLERRPYCGGVNGALEWKITNAGLLLVQSLLTTSEPVPA